MTATFSKQLYFFASATFYHAIIFKCYLRYYFLEQLIFNIYPRFHSQTSYLLFSNYQLEYRGFRAYDKRWGTNLCTTGKIFPLNIMAINIASKFLSRGSIKQE